MSGSNRVLVIDDEEAFAAAYEQLPSREGYDVVWAPDAASARTRLDEGGWAVVLLDQKLQGALGPDSGLDLLEDIMVRSPSSRTIVTTAYANEAAIEYAFRRGAFDYLQKDKYLEVLLRIKARNAASAHREAETAAVAAPAVAPRLAALHAEAMAEADANRKGALLEELIADLLRTIPGFRRVSLNRRNEVEEIDAIVRNESRDPFWEKFGPYILVECKHWSRPVGKNEVVLFRDKLTRRYGTAGLGLFVAPGGFARTFRLADTARSETGPLIIPIAADALAGLIASDDPNEFLKGLADQAIV